MDPVASGVASEAGEGLSGQPALGAPSLQHTPRSQLVGQAGRGARAVQPVLLLLIVLGFELFISNETWALIYKPQLECCT